MSVRTDAPAYVPAGNPPQQVGNTSVSAHAMLPGASGNIGALDINSALQGNYNGIEVKNQAAFSGGQDEQTYPVVSKSDITSAAGPLVTSLTQAAQAVLQAQLGKSEQFLTPQASCQPTVRANPAAGQPGQQVTVAVQVTCHRDAFDQQQLTGLAASRFSRQAMAQLGSGYAPVGSPTTGRVQVIVINESLGHFTLIVPVSGRFVYQFSRSLLESLPGHLVNMSSSAASSLLLNTPGIAQASIQLSGWNNGMLPAEPTRIHVILMAPRSA